jgi:uncharacterized protein (DUF952 family)
MARWIYKIFRLSEWEAAHAAGVFDGSPDDMRDGFIHFSMGSQLRGTARKHFAREEAIIIGAVDADALGDALKWETSRGGENFPHLYASLEMSLMKQLWFVVRKDGHYVFPDEIP